MIIKKLENVTNC